MRKLLTVLAPRSITAKLAIMAVAGALFMVLVAVTVLLIARPRLVAERTEKAHAIVDSVWSLADGLQHKADTGAMTPDQARAAFIAAAGTIWFENHSNYVFIYDTDTAINLVNTGNTAMVGKDMRAAKDSNGKPFAAIILDSAKQGGEGTIQYAFPKGTNPTPLAKIAYFRAFAPWHMVIVSAEYIADIDADFWAMTRTAALVIGALLLLSLAIAWAVARGIIRPLAVLRTRMAGLRAGDLDTPVPGADRHDELGEMARAVLVFKDHMIRGAQLATEQEAERQRAEATQRRAALTGMADTVEAETGEALRTIGLRTKEMAATADAMSNSATRTGGSAREASTAAAQALATAQTVASAAEQLSASIQQIGGQVGQSTAVVGRAVTFGNEARTTIEALNQEVERIGAVAGMIGEIAGKTNLLALNATIEAARAGDAGKGFAVVASEVKALATQTARSTREIAGLIDQVRAATGASVAAVARIEATITEIDSIASSIAGAVEQQGAATLEIARNVTETASAANEMTRRTEEVTAEAVDTGRRAVEVRDNIVALNQAVEELRHSVTRVVRTSTDETDRRQASRHDVDLPAHLIVSGQSEAAVRIRNISEHGALVAGVPGRSIGGQSIGTGCVLRLDGVAIPLTGVVRGSDGDGLHVAFTLDATAQAALRALLDRVVGRRAA